MIPIRETDFSSQTEIDIYIFSRRTRGNDVPSRIHISLDYCVKLRKGKRIDLIGTCKSSSKSAEVNFRSECIKYACGIIPGNISNVNRLISGLLDLLFVFPAAVYQLITRQWNVY